MRSFGSSAQAFRSDLLSGYYQVPSYASWLAKCDMRPGYAYHSRVLRLLQRDRPTRRWVLKAPSHLWTLEALLAVYPDARVVWTHRDPLVVLPSMASLAATLYWLRSDRVDPKRIARQTVKVCISQINLTTWRKNLLRKLDFQLDKRLIKRC